MDIITISILAYLANGLCLWCFTLQVEPSSARGIRSLLGHTLFWPLIYLLCIVFAIGEAW